MSAYSVDEQIEVLKWHVCCHTGEEIDALVDAIRAELRAQLAADVAHAIDTLADVWGGGLVPGHDVVWRIARSIALDTITNPKEQP